MGQHKKSDHAARKAKYDRQKLHTEMNKKKHIAKMMKDNPCYPKKKGTC